MKYYIAGCVFSAQFPELSRRIRETAAERYGLEVLRCCIPNYKVKEFEDRMPEDCRSEWQALPTGVVFKPGDEVYSICHNCLNIIEEMYPEVRVHSLWELIASDDSFPLPSMSEAQVIVQDCWR
ncbi:MAG: hypothetical protein MJ099_03905, partial [Clostridia bacterium]|nr:hypothetical protein [Clostridia bacterium]